MPILSIEHVTSYRYYQPVAFGKHRMMLRPRDDDDQKVLQCQLEIRPKPRELAWGKDKLGNHVAIAHFADRSDELRVVSTICLEHAPNGFYEADITDYARIYPFSYIAEDWSRLRRFILPLSLEPELRLWSDRFFRNGSDTHGLLVDMTQTIRRTLRHVARHEKGIQDPIRTIALGSGSCRDLAMLMMAALRSRGIAARFVSGYLHLAEEEHEDEHQITGGNHPRLGPSLRSRSWLGRLRSVGGCCGKPEPHPRRGRGAPARRNSSARDMVWKRVELRRHASSGEGQSGVKRRNFYAIQF